MFSAVISQHFSKKRMNISVVAAKIWYLKKCTVFIGPPCTLHVCVQLKLEDQAHSLCCLQCLSPLLHCHLHSHL